MEKSKIEIIDGSMEDMVGQFNYDILGLELRPLGLQPLPEITLTLKQLREEADELEEAFTEQDFIGCVDALCDNMYFAIGALLKHGLKPHDIQACMSIIHERNMSKKMGKVATRKVEGDPADAVKPADWVGPEAGMIEYFGDRL